MKRFAIACVAVMGLMVAGSSMASAGGYYFGGHGGHGGHGAYLGGHGGFYGGHAYTPHVYGHRTIHHNVHRTHGFGHVNIHHGGHGNIHHGGYFGH